MSTDGQLERIVGQAVRTLVKAPARSAWQPAPAVTRVPLKLRGADDVALLLSWIRRLCADEGWRQRFLSGQLELAIEVAPQEKTLEAPENVAAGAAAIAPVAAERHTIALEDQLVTEAVLRRHAKRDDVVALPTRAVVTPSARDYARAAGIRMERKT